MTLSRRVGRGVAWVAGGEMAHQAMTFVFGIILARLLTPADFGLVVMAMFVVSFIEMFGRCGLTEALIQREEVTADDWSSVYWVGLGVGLLVGVSAWLVAPVAASFYRDERVTMIVRALGWSAFLASLGATQGAWLAKQMRFRTIAQVEWARVLAGGTVGVAMAWTGWGVWSLVANALVDAAMRAFLLYFWCPWRPRWKVRLSTLRWAVRFGLGLQGFGVMNYLNRKLDDALIGRYVGPVAVGHYARAYRLMLYPVQNIAGVVGKVMFPALSEIGNDLPRFRAAYLRAVSAIATVGFPAMLGLMVTAPEVIQVVYGPQWAPAIPVLQVLCVVGLLHSVGTTVGWIFLARARTGLMMIWEVVESVVLWTSFVLGLRWGIMGVAVAYAIASGLLLVPSLAVPFRVVQLPLLELFRSVRGALAGALLMAGTVAIVRAMMLAGEARPPAVLTWSVLTGVLTYLMWLWLTDAKAVQEARLAWSRMFTRRGAEAFRG